MQKKDLKLKKTGENSWKGVSVGVGVMLLKERRILLGKRHEDSEKADSELHGEGAWTMPGGKVDFGEKLSDAAVRETEEETSIKLNNFEICSVEDNIIEDAHFVTIGFVSEDFEGQAKIMEPDEITKWHWFEINNLPSEMFFPSEKIVKNYLSGEMY